MATISHPVKKKKISFNLADSIARKIILAILAISYGSNFAFLPIEECEFDVRKIVVWPVQKPRNQSCTVRACKPICQFHRAAAPKNSVGKIGRESLFYRKLYDFWPTAMYVLDYYSPTSNSHHESRSFFIID